MKRDVSFTVNGEPVSVSVEPRRLLTDVLREDLRLTGTHVGCEHGVCGACTILIDGEPQRACLVFAVQVEGKEVGTVEGMAESVDQLHPIQNAFWEMHGLQCGFCTSGIMLTVQDLLERTPNPNDDEIRTSLTGNMCRCTGYVHIVNAVKKASRLMMETDQ